MNDARRAIWPALAIIATVAAVASYLQALVVVQAADGRGPVTYFVAALADPTIFAASANIYDAYRRKERLPLLSMLSVVVAGVVTGGANVMAGHPHEVPAWLVRLWPPVAFLLALESLMSYVRRGRDVVPSQDGAAAGGHCPHGVAGTAEEAALNAYRHARDCLLAPVSFRQLEPRFGVRRDRLSELEKSSTNGDGSHA